MRILLTCTTNSAPHRRCHATCSVSVGADTVIPTLTLAAPPLFHTPVAWIERLEWQGRGGYVRIDSSSDPLVHFIAYTAARAQAPMQPLQLVASHCLTPNILPLQRLQDIRVVGEPEVRAKFSPTEEKYTLEATYLNSLGHERGFRLAFF